MCFYIVKREMGIEARAWCAYPTLHSGGWKTVGQNRKKNNKQTGGLHIFAEILSHQILFHTSITWNLTFLLDVSLIKDGSNNSSNCASETLLAWHSSTLGLLFILRFAQTPRGDNRNLKNVLLASRSVYPSYCIIESMLTLGRLGLDSLDNKE